MSSVTSSGDVIAAICDVSHSACDVSHSDLIIMDKSEVSRPIIIILDGLNYIPWSQAMSSFLKGRKLWRYVTGDIQAPTQGAAETPTEFIVRLEEWDTTRYTTADLACQYQLMTSLCRQRQEPRQSISAFLPQIYSIWDQLTPSKPKWLCAGDSTLFSTYRDQQRLILFLMGLSDIYEPVRASLLHRIPLPTLEQAISKLLSEETRLGLVFDFPCGPLLLLLLVPEDVAPLVVLVVFQPLVLNPLVVQPLGLMSAHSVMLLTIACSLVLFGFANLSPARSWPL
ncbi:hypothetical protein Acr_00g0059180 [Actinidia rufa]|uniref:Retrotransposon Copia-like N-terminal domain-containing protein n=1 Tax=Actinidia rufa TaxID=165716 RepID=A0A7J0DNM1_9ERIC|nr:hypothetical protein Acr_00g0059180 [Actinidia rufa]